MQIPPLWIAVLVACVLAVPFLLRISGVRAKAVLPRKRLSFDERPGALGSAHEAPLFRLGRLSLSEPDAERVRR